MRLDASAVKAMNLFPLPKDGSNKTMSIFGLLNRCRTSQGTRLLQQWLSQPLINVIQIKERQDLVEMLLQETSLRLSLQDEHLKRMPDFARLANKFRRGRANLQDAVRLYQAIVRLPALHAIVIAHCVDFQHGELLRRIFGDSLAIAVKETMNLKQLVETTIDLSLVDHHEYLIRPDFDEELGSKKFKLYIIFGRMRNSSR